MFANVGKVNKLIKTSLSTKISKEVPLSSIKEALDFYKNNMTLGKVLIKPSSK